MATVSDSEMMVIGESWEIGVGFTGEGGTAADGLRGVIARGEGGGITVKEARETGEWVTRVALRLRALGSPRDGSGICSCGS